MKTGILGGTFNPIHIAHLRIAEEVRESCGLDRILFLPAASPPHKSVAEDIAFAHRLAVITSYSIHYTKLYDKLNVTIELYDQDEPIFDAFGLEVEIARALGRKVWLKSGGYIIIEQTEALTAIDVNTGRFVGKHNLEDTILKTNLVV